MLKNIQFYKGVLTLLIFLLSMSIVITIVAHNNGSTINDYLGISTSRVIIDDDVDLNVDTNYFTSAYGDFTYENQMALVADTVEQNINEMREGAVLLYNVDRALPLTNNEKDISVFGHASVDPVYKGASAGNIPTDSTYHTVTLDDALTHEGFNLNEALWTALENGSAERSTISVPNESSYFASASAAGSEEPISFYTALDYSWQSSYHDVAILTIAREGAEGRDLAMDDMDDDGVTTISSLALHQNERDLLQYLDQSFNKVIVLLNSPNQLEIEDMKPYVDAILYIGQPGQQGFTGVAEILTGSVNPSGRLADTYAVNSLSSPAVVNSGTRTPKYSNVDEINATIGSNELSSWMSFQAENIYIGYRYYETRYEDLILNQGGAESTVGSSTGGAWHYADEMSYPFGYGLSYTTFEQSLDEVRVTSDEVIVTATVENTGNVAGKSVVQVYVQTPYGDYEIQHGVEKSAIQLGGFAKTTILEPGETETLTVTVDKYLLASYDANNEEGYILSGGDYYFAIGDHVHDALNHILASKGATGMYDIDGHAVNGNADKAYKFSMPFDAAKYQTSSLGVVQNRFDDCNLNYWIEDAGTYLTRNDWAGTYPTTQTVVSVTEEMLDILDGDEYVKADDAPGLNQFIFNEQIGLQLVDMIGVPYEDTLWDTFIEQMTLSELAITTVQRYENPVNPSIGVPSFVVGDGDDSLGLDFPFKDNGETVPTMTYASKTILTGTFNVDLYQKRGNLMGEEGVWCKSMQNYNIGANLHRTPFGGRAYEYMSECPTLSYLASIPEVQAMEATGSHAAPKHFAGNDQEYHREGVACYFTEQAFREGSLRAFEGAIRVAKSGGVMQSFERLGVRYASSSYALNTNILREEWGWTGNIVTDAVFNAREGYKSHYVTMQASGTQQYCLDYGGWSGQTLKTYIIEHDDGHILGLMQQGAKDWYYGLANSPAMNGIPKNSHIEYARPLWSILTISVTTVLSVLTVGSSLLLILSAKRQHQEVSKTKHNMSMFIYRLSHKDIGLYMTMISILMGIVAMILYIVFLFKVNIAEQRNPWILVLMMLGILMLMLSTYVKDMLSDILSIGTIVLFITAIGLGMQYVLNNMADYIQGITMFGDSSVAKLQMMIVVFTVIMTLGIVISSFFKPISFKKTLNTEKTV